MNGGSGRNWYLPASISTSTYCTPRARIRTVISPGPGGGGSGTSRSASTSGPPNASHTIAFMPHRSSVRRRVKRSAARFPTLDATTLGDTSLATPPWHTTLGDTSLGNAGPNQHRPVMRDEQCERRDPGGRRRLQQV